MTTKPTEKDLVEEVEALLASPDKYSDPFLAFRLLRRLKDEVKELRAKLNDPCLVAGYHVCGGKHDLGDPWKGNDA